MFACFFMRLPAFLLWIHGITALRYKRQPVPVALSVGSCSSGTCVPYYLCKEGDIIVDGEGIIDVRSINQKKLPNGNESEVRLVGGNCPNYLDVCCNNVQEVPVPNFTPAPPSRELRCGQRNFAGLDVRVVYNKTKNGLRNEAQPGEFPWMVVVLKVVPVPSSTNPNKVEDQHIFVCGGSLIHPQVVLTAAHCIAGKDPQTLRVRLGEWDTRSTQEPFQHIDKKVLSVSAHHGYSAHNLFNDIALLFLEGAVELTRFINAICLTPYPNKFSHRECVATGWGKDSFGAGGKFQNILKRVDLPLVSYETCLQAFKRTRLGVHFCLHDTFICAGGEKGEDTCKGDGGSPLVCKSPDTGAYYQAGIVAWGIGCGEDATPGAYVDVTRYAGWIDQTIKQSLHLPTLPFSFEEKLSISAPRYQACLQENLG